jgi:CelD/BcsL family acetyltransferase involved in cellulose biosynthesis
MISRLENARQEVIFQHEPLPPLGELEREWRALETAAEASFFISWAWIGTLLNTIPADRRPMLLRGREGGETVALGLLGSATTRRRHGLIRARGLYLNEIGDPQYDVMTIEHNRLLTAADCETRAHDALAAWFAAHGGEADELYLSGVRHPLSAPGLVALGLSLGETALPSYSIELGRLAPGDGALDPVLSANARQQLRRAFRHFSAQGALELRRAASEAETQRWFTALKALHVSSWARRNRVHSFTRPFFERFHRRLIERSFAAGAVQMLEARAGERVIGYLYNFYHGGRIYAYQSGFEDADPRERPGYVCHALAICEAFRSGMRIYDFMAGRNRLKETFATRCEPMWWQVVRQPRLRFRLEDLGRRVKEALRPAQICLLPRSQPDDTASTR